MTNAQELIGLSIAACTLLAILGGWFRWVRPRYRRTKAEAVSIRDAIIGREPVVDTITGKQISPALPGIGQRIATVEDALLKLTDQQAQLNEHDQRITILEEARAERVITQAESAAMWRAVGNAQDSPPEEC